MAFDTTHRSLGRIQSNKMYHINFPYDNTVADISSIEVSCGCTGASNSRLNREVVISYKPDSVPHHLKGQGFYYARNYATVTIVTTNGETIPITLTFEATIY